MSPARNDATATTEPAEAPEGTRTLHQRLAAIQAAVGAVKPTGKTQYGSAAISISDVEEELRPLFAEHGVLSLWSMVALSPVPGSERLWQCFLKLRLVNADDRADAEECEWSDIGNSPMAAASFARKGVWKSMFHLTEPDDETADRGNGRAPAAVQSSQAPAPLDETRTELLRAIRALPDAQRAVFLRAHRYNREPLGVYAQRLSDEEAGQALVDVRLVDTAVAG